MARRHRHLAPRVQFRHGPTLQFLASAKLALATRLEVCDGWSCERCCAAAEGPRDRTARDTPPLGRVLPSTRSTRWYSFNCYDLRLFGTGQYPSDTGWYLHNFNDLASHRNVEKRPNIHRSNWAEGHQGAIPNPEGIGCARC